MSIDKIIVLFFFIVNVNFILFGSFVNSYTFEYIEFLFDFKVSVWTTIVLYNSCVIVIRNSLFI